MSLSQRAGSGREALPEGREWLEFPPRKARSGLESLTEDREDLPEGQKWSVGSPGGLGVVGRPSRKARSSRDALPSGSGLGVVGWQSRKVRTGRECIMEGREALPEGREWLGGPHKGSGEPPDGPGVVHRPYQMAWSGWEAITEGGRHSQMAGSGWEDL